MKYYLLLLITSLFISSASAQEIKILTLPEAVTLGLANSHTLQLSNAKVEQAEAKYQQAVGQTLPSLKLSGGYARLSDIEELKIDFNKDGNPVVLYPNIPNTYTTHLGLNETVFSGFRLKYAKESYQLLRSASTVDASKDTQEVIINIVTSLYNLYKIRQTKEIIEENIALSQKRVDEVNTWEKNGIVTHNEVLKWQLQLSNNQLAKIDLENTRELANFNLNLLLGADGNQQYDIDSASLFSNYSLSDFTSYNTVALKSRAELAAITLRTDAAKNNLMVTKNGYWPQIGVGANYYYSRPNSRIFPPTDEFNSTWDVGINLTFDLTNLYTNKANIRDAQSLLDQATAQQSILSDAIRSEVNQAYIATTQSSEREKVLIIAEQQAEENYRITENKYRSQLVLQTELQDASNALLKTKIDLINANADTHLAYYKLMKASGILSIK